MSGFGRILAGFQFVTPLALVSIKRSRPFAGAFHNPKLLQFREITPSLAGTDRDSLGVISGLEALPFRERLEKLMLAKRQLLQRF